MEEIIDVVDENDSFVRKATRQEVVQKGLLHRDSRIIIQNSKGEFVVQKRSMDKDNYPGCYDIGVAETVKGGESYESAAIRGIMEELGIVGISNISLMRSLLFKMRYKSDNLNEHCKVYYLIYGGKMQAQKEEIDELKLLKEDELIGFIKSQQFHPAGKMAFEKYLEKNEKMEISMKKVSIED